MKNIRTPYLKNKTLHIISMLGILFFLFSACEKKEDFMFSAIDTIDGITIHDIVPYSDSLLIIVGNNESAAGKLIKYNKRTNTFTSVSTDFILRDVCVSNTGLWASGDSMLIMHSVDTAKTWSKVSDFSYFWDIDKSDFKEMYVKNNELWYAIGSKNSLNGNFYYTTHNSQYPLSSKQTQAGVNDMVLYGSDEAYIACFGSILHSTENGKKMEYETVGGHNFTGVAISDSSVLLTCTFEGTIHKMNISNSSWTEVVKSAIPFRYIAADNYGNVIAIGDSNTIYISNDSGETWRIEKYKNGRDVTCLSVENGVFYIGSKSGVIQSITRNQIEQL